MRRRHQRMEDAGRGIVVAVAIAALVWAAVLSSSAAPRRSAARGSGQAAALYSVDALKPSNAWAVGQRFPDSSDYGDFVTSTDHFKYGSWSRVSSPNPSSTTAALYGVDALSATNVWAVGQYNSKGGNDFTLIEHRAGSSWKIVGSPNPARFGNGLASVSAVSPDDVWAVGYEGPPHTLIVRWRGSGWKLVSSPNPQSGTGAADALYGVSAVSAGNAWAVGFAEAPGGPARTLIEHWNGSGWKVQSSPSPSTADSELFGVKALSASDVWAVGSFTDGTGDHPLIEHYDGASWSKVPAGPLAAQGSLAAVSADAKDDAWAVGTSGGSATKTLTMHWDGKAWATVASPDPSTHENALLGVGVEALGDVWAVGYYRASSGHRSLVLHWNGSAWSVR